jgi:hypothetical protein
MTAEQTRNTAARGGAPVVRLPLRPDRPAEPDLRERLGEFRALLVISLLMTESVNEDQILELAASSAPGLGSWRIEGYGFTNGQWRPYRPPGARRRPALSSQPVPRGPRVAVITNSGRAAVRGRVRPAPEPGRRAVLPVAGADGRGGWGCGALRC